MPATSRHHSGTIIHQEPLGRKIRFVFAPEIIVEARDRRSAQRALNLIVAAKTLRDGDFTSGEPFTAIPDNPNDPEDLNAFEFETGLGMSSGTFGWGTAAAIAAKATRGRGLKFGVVKYWLSLRTCSVPAIEHHPLYGERFTVERDPFNYTMMAQAIVAAYSAIEELGVEIRASEKNPSKIDGEWNPRVLQDLRTRLRQAGIDEGRPLVWHLRNSPTRIERRHAPPRGKRASWARYAVRDREVRLVDAIHYAGLLRSRVSSHRIHELTRSLTMHDVANVQHLARRLLLESLGFWQRL
jgi:hypothetical protein